MTRKIKNTSLTNNLFYNICYQLLSLIVPLVTAPYISRVLGADGLGEYSYTYSIAHYFVLFIMLGVLNYGNREIARVKELPSKIEDKFSEIFSVQFTMGIVVLICYVTYLNFFCREYRFVAIAQSLYIISGILDISWFYFGIEQFKTTAGISSINKLVTTLLIFCLVKNESDVYIYTLIIAGGVLLNNLMYWVFIRKYIHHLKLSFSGIKYHIKPLLILFVPVIAVSIYKYMDKIMLGMMVNTTEVGVYEAAEKFVNLPLCLITAIGTVMLPRISSMRIQNNENGVKKYNYISMCLIMFLSFGIAFGLGSISQKFIPWFYGSDFKESAKVLVVLLPSVVFVCWANVIRTQCLLPNRRDTEYCISVILGAVVNFVINLICIPKYGAIGAALGTTIAELAVCILQSVQTKESMEYGTYIKKCFLFLINAVIMYVIVSRVNFESDIITSVSRVFAGALLYTIISLYFIKGIINEYKK